MPNATTKKTTKKAPVRTEVTKTVPAPQAQKTSRRRLPAAPQWRRGFALQPIAAHVPLPNVWRLTRAVALLLWANRKLFITLALVYGVLNLILVRGFTGGLNVTHLKGQLQHAVNGQYGALATGLTVFASLVSTSGNTSSSTGGAYQTFLLIIMSLAVIWALRMATTGESVRLRDTFYKSMYPLIPFLLVFAVICLQLVPLLIGAGTYTTVISNGIAINVFEKVLWGIGCGLLVAVSFYLIASSIFALYIVTLPNMTPFKALRSARELVRGRRLSVLRKLLFLPLALFLIALIIMVPVILVAAPLAQWLFFILTMCSLIAIHAYLYSLYRELLA